MKKIDVYDALFNLIQSRGAEMQLAWNELMESNKQEGKSSAGDKHETALSMMHLEQEKLNYKLQEILAQKAILDKIDPNAKHTKISLGSLVQT